MSRRNARSFDPRAFLHANAMPVVACVAALVTCAFVPPDAAYADYLDWGTLGKLACMLLAVGGLRESGAFQALAARVVARCPCARALVCALVGTTALASMFVTNDMALLGLLPLAAACLLAAGRPDLLAPTFVLQGLAANLCGMLLPFGNPQNIYLAGRYAVGAGDFVRTMLSPFALATLGVALACVALTREGRRPGGRAARDVTRRAAPDVAVAGPAASSEGDPMSRAVLAGSPVVPPRAVPARFPGEGSRLSVTPSAPAISGVAPAAPVDRRRAALSAAALLACVLAVLGVLPVWACLLAVAALTLAADFAAVSRAPGEVGRRGVSCECGSAPAVSRVPRAPGAASPASPRLLALRIDWGLVVTFAAFFVFSGNLARIDAVRDAFVGWLAGGAFVPAALLSQLVSNVPAAIVLSRFTDDWPGLLAGVNVGGAGTPVASLATLIVLAQYAALAPRLPGVAPTRRFVALLLAANAAFLVALLAAGVLLGW